MKVYVIPGNPVPLARARVHNRKFYDPQKSQKLFSGITLDSQHDGSKLSGALHLIVTFYMPIPKSSSKKVASKLVGVHHKIKPDIDNMIKYVSDVCNGLFYHDDCIISRITANKVYGIIPRTEFSFEEIK